MEYGWVVSPIPNEENVLALSNNAGFPTAIAKILVSRGIDTAEKSKAFFKPAIGHLNDPFLLDGMDKAVDRILKAIANNEKILIFGDYDVDGTNSIAMLYLFFKELGITVYYYIPFRLEGEFGISNATIDSFKKDNISLIITVDYGITSIEAVRYAKELGIDTIVSDHHIPGDEIPDALAVLNPLKKGCSYPFKYLCGCGVAFKIIDAICRRIQKPTLALPYLQFAAIATMADIVPVVEENRVIVHYGLEILNEVPCSGFEALIEITGLSTKKISSSQIVFILAPRINAVGRLGDAKRAVELLISQDLEKALGLAKVLEEENRKRCGIDKIIYERAQEMAEELLSTEPDMPIVLYESSWHPGVIAIVASRLAEKYSRPTIMMTSIKEGIATGSARSVNGFDMFEALKKCERHLKQFGGHKYAAGLEIEVKNIDEFRVSFKAASKNIFINADKRPQLLVDAKVNFPELTMRFKEFIQCFSPYGPMNMRPRFLTENVEIIDTRKISKQDKVKIKVRQQQVTFDAICFNIGDKLKDVIKSNRFVDIVYSIEDSDKSNPIQLKIRDLKISN